jgi:N-formylglutamate deformylase
MIVNIPHSSKEIPAGARKQFLLSDTDLTTEMIRLTDSYTDELFSASRFSMIVFPVSRLVVDPERFLDDAYESMQAMGMGVVYIRTSQGEVNHH